MKAWRTCNPTVFLLLQWMTTMMAVKVLLLWEVDICHKKMHSLWWCQCDVASDVCVNCQRSGCILPPLLELWHCSSYECFFMTCSLHSLRGKESMLNLAHFSSLRTIDTLYRETVKCISEVWFMEGGWLSLLWKYNSTGGLRKLLGWS